MRIRNRPAYEAGLLLDESHRPGSVVERRGRVTEPHVAELHDLTREVARATGEEVPLVDPASGGRDAQVLLLLEEHVPCRTAGSGVVSLHANDPTAGNALAACQRAGLEYRELMLWQVIPWWTHDPASGAGQRRARAAEASRAAPYVARLVGMLPCLQAVVLLGTRTQQAWRRTVAATDIALPGHVRVLAAPHPSPMAWHMSGRDGIPHRELTVAALARARATCRR